MILLRYEIRVCYLEGTGYVVHRRFLTYDGAAYCLGKFRSISHHLQPRIYDRRKRRYLT